MYCSRRNAFWRIKINHVHIRSYLCFITVVLKLLGLTLYIYIFCWPCISIYFLIGNQLAAQFFYIIHLFKSSTCFEQIRPHHQEVNCINTASGIVTLCQWPSGMQVEQELLDMHTGRPLTESDYTRCCINTIDLLMMRTCLLETCRGLK